MPKRLKFNAGDIYLTRFHPGYGKEFRRFRPVVIISSKISGIDSRFVLIAPFTTQLDIRNKKTELLISKNNALEEDSLLLAWYLQTVDSRRLAKKLGSLQARDIDRMNRALQYLFE